MAGRQRSQPFGSRRATWRGSPGRRWIGVVALLLVVGGGFAWITLDHTGSALSAVETDSAARPRSANLYVSRAGNDASCKRGVAAKPCATIPRAYRLARPGDVVEVAAGTYEDFQLSGSKGGSARVVFRVAPGALVNFDSRVDFVDLHGVNFVGFQFRTDDPVNIDLLIDHCNSDIAIINARDSRKFGFLEGNRNIVFRGGAWGGYRIGEDSGIGWVGRDACADGSTPGLNKKILFDRVLFHDVYYRVPASQWDSNHPDCFQIDGAVDGLVIRNSKFIRCGNTFLLITPDLGPPGLGDVLNVTIENNLFWQLSDDSYYGIQIHKNTDGLYCGNLVFRNNTYIPMNPDGLGPFSSIRIDCEPKPGTKPAVVTGNILERAPGLQCNLFARWSHNVYEHTSGLCGRPRRVGAVGFVDRDKGNFHLVPGSRAVDAGNPKSYAQRDVDGDVRPAGALPDAGFDEVLTKPVKKAKNAESKSG